MQPKFAKEVKPPDLQCLSFRNNICQKQNLPNCSQCRLAIATQSKSLPNTNSHAPTKYVLYEGILNNPQKHANHPQQPYHTRDRSPHIVHAVFVDEDTAKHTPCKSPLTNYVLYEGSSPSKICTSVNYRFNY